MTGSYIATTTEDDVQWLMAAGQSLGLSVAQLRHHLAQHLSPAHGALLAEPVEDLAARATDWYGPGEGAAVPLEQTPPDVRATTTNTVWALLRDIGVEGVRLGASVDSDERVLGAMLERVSHVPDTSCVRVRNDAPLVIAWGHGRAGQSVDLARLYAPVEVPRPPQPPREAEPAPAEHRRRWLAPAGVMAALLAGAGLLVWSQRSPDEPAPATVAAAPSLAPQASPPADPAPERAAPAMAAATAPVDPLPERSPERPAPTAAATSVEPPVPATVNLTPPEGRPLPAITASAPPPRQDMPTPAPARPAPPPDPTAPVSTTTASNTDASAASASALPSSTTPSSTTPSSTAPASIMPSSTTLSSNTLSSTTSASPAPEVQSTPSPRFSRGASDTATLSNEPGSGRASLEDASPVPGSNGAKPPLPAPAAVAGLDSRPAAEPNTDTVPRPAPLPPHESEAAASARPFTLAALTAQNLAMLRGCWTLRGSFATADVLTQAAAPVSQWRTCFPPPEPAAAAASGTQSLAWEDGKSCSGPVTARFLPEGGLEIADAADCLGDRTLFRIAEHCSRKDDAAMACAWTAHDRATNRDFHGDGLLLTPAR